MIPWTLFLAWRWFVELRGKASKTSKTCQNLNIKAVQHGIFYVQFKECTLISQGYLRLKFGGKQDKILSLGNPIFKLFLTMLGRQHVECLKVRTCTNIQFFFLRGLRPTGCTPICCMSMLSQSSTAWFSQRMFIGLIVLPRVCFWKRQTSQEEKKKLVERSLNFLF